MGRTKKTKKTDLGPARDAGDVLGPARDDDDDSPQEMDINETDPQDDPHGNSDDADSSDDDSAVETREFVRDFYERTIGLNRTASYALYVDENMKTARDFRRIRPENIEKICTAIKKAHKTPISIMAMERLALFA